MTRPNRRRSRCLLARYCWHLACATVAVARWELDARRAKRARAAADVAAGLLLAGIVLAPWVL